MSLLDDGSAGLVANPPRIIFDTLRGELTQPRVEPGDPASPIVLVEFPVPQPTRIVNVLAFVSGREIRFPIPQTSADGFVTLSVPASWRGKAVIKVEVQSGAIEGVSAWVLNL